MIHDPLASIFPGLFHPTKKRQLVVLLIHSDEWLWFSKSLDKTVPLPIIFTCSRRKCCKIERIEQRRVLPLEHRSENNGERDGFFNQRIAVKYVLIAMHHSPYQSLFWALYYFNFYEQLELKCLMSGKKVASCRNLLLGPSPHKRKCSVGMSYFVIICRLQSHT